MAARADSQGNDLSSGEASAPVSDDAKDRDTTDSMPSSSRHPKSTAGFAFNFEPYSLQLAAGRGWTHHLGGLDVLFLWPISNHGYFNLYAGLGWNVASLRVRMGADFLFRRREDFGPVVRLGGRFEPLSWINESPEGFGDANYTIGVIGEAGLGWHFTDSRDEAHFRFLFVYLMGPRWPIAIGEATNNGDGEAVIYHGGAFQIEIGG